MNKKAALVGGLGLGAALMYLFDPDRGRRRRALIRDKAEGAANKAGDYAGKMSRDLRNRAYGVVAETKSIFRYEEVTDNVLIDRVRAKLGHYSGHSGAIDVTAQSGTVILSGRVLAKEVPDVLRAVRSVRGVKSVENQLVMHPEPGSVPSLQDTPAPLGEQPDTATAGGI
jgi:osmotically-inducible protein OsmY